MTADAPADTTADTDKKNKARKNKAPKAGRSVRLPKDKHVRILSAVCVVLLVATAALAFLYVREQQASSARNDATSAATTDVPELLSYTFSSFSTDLSKAEAVTTPSFRSTYSKLMTSEIEGPAKQNQVVTSSAVSNSSVISSSGSRVTLLLFLSQQTKTKAKAESVLNDNAVRVVMVKQGGQWLVDNVTPHP